ncbi:MAG TPA: outer membrane lipoprotein-sorting protein, partial [Helicobacteraceae bacterium]|nr:outer membrane lipoprotein-sorting protein [Helicobacteraceae bacterium]
MMRRFVMVLIVLSISLMANEAADIIKKVDQNVRGKNVYMKLSMSISAMGHTRTMKMESWAEGTKKNFTKITYPPKDRGITFLSLNNQMWQYVPKIERIIKIPSS